jgi:hypothetical protein
MGKYVMVVQSRAKPGREDEYNRWYDTQHIPDICAVPGVKSGRRLEATPIHVGAPGLPILTLYEIEADDAASVLAEIAKRSADGTIRRTDALDSEASVMWFYADPRG